MHEELSKLKLAVIVIYVSWAVTGVKVVNVLRASIFMLFTCRRDAIGAVREGGGEGEGVLHPKSLRGSWRKLILSVLKKLMALN
jgi:hypothetical protein